MWVFFSPIKRIVKWKYRNENYDPSQQSMAGDWCVSFRQVPQVSKTNFPLRIHGSLGPGLHCVGQATAGMPQGPKDAALTCLWLSCTGLLHGLSTCEQHCDSTASCLLTGCRRHPRWPPVPNLMRITVASSIICTHPRRMLLRTRGTATCQALSLTKKEMGKANADSSHGTNLRCGGSLKY